MDMIDLIIWKILPRGFHFDIWLNKVLNAMLKMSPFQCFCEQNLENLRKDIENKRLAKSSLLF